MFPFRTVGLLAGTAMFIPWADSRVCTAWLRCLVRIAQRSLCGRTTVRGGWEPPRVDLKAGRLGLR